MSTRTGWMPYQNADMHGDAGPALDARLDALYAFCQEHDVPILNHTSPTGFPPEDLLVLPRLYEEGPGFFPAGSGRVQGVPRPCPVKARARGRAHYRASAGRPRGRARTAVSARS